MADRPSHLRVAGPDEKPKPETPVTISAAVETGSSRDVMAAMRKALAAKLDAGEVSSNAIASAYKELRELDRLIRLLDSAEEDDEPQDDVDESFDASAV